MSDPLPQRIGDAERDRAADYLREHMSVGRLSQDEFDERVTAALQARTAADLEPLFSDLPAPRPGPGRGGRRQHPRGRPTSRPPRRRRLPAAAPMPDSTLANVLAAASGIAWVLFILNCGDRAGRLVVRLPPDPAVQPAREAAPGAAPTRGAVAEAAEPAAATGIADRSVRLILRQRVSRTDRFRLTLDTLVEPS